MRLLGTYYRFLIFINLIFISIWLFPKEHKAVQAQQDEEKPLIVVTKVIEPFVIKEGERFSGFSIDLLKEIEFITEIPIEIIEVDTVAQQLDAVRSGKADMAIAAISMTPEREEFVDFSYPYFTSGLQILADSKPPSTLSRLFSFLTSSRFFIGILALMGIMIAIGHIVWLAERGKNPDFPEEYLPGIWEGLWWAAVTVTTVGYGDKRVKDKLGRVLAMLWMFAGLFLIANFTAFVTAEVTVTSLAPLVSGLDDLPGKRVVTVNNTTSSEFLHQRDIPFLGVRSIDDAYTLLETGQADAILYDAPVLQHFVNVNNIENFQLVGDPFKPEDYGIALQVDSPYEEVINQALLEINSNGTFEELANRWALSE